VLCYYRVGILLLISVKTYRYLFKEGKLCIPLGSYRKLLVKETHDGGLTKHFGVMPHGLHTPLPVACAP